MSRTGEEPRERYKSRPDYLRFKKRQETALNILANLEEFEEKELKKAKQAGFNVGIKNFDETNFLGNSIGE